MSTTSRWLILAGGLALCAAGGSLGSLPARGDDSAWATRASMATPRNFPGVATCDGKVYVVGGHDGGTILDTLEVYDPATNSWETKSPMPTARLALGFVALDGLLYAIGGEVGGTETGAVEAYDPVTDTWTSRSPLLEVRVGLAAAVLDGKIYVMGGAASSDGLTKSSVEVYDPQGDAWTSGPSMLSPRHYFPATVANGLLYVVGGAIAQTGSRLDGVESLDPATGEWTARAGLPAPLEMSAAATIDGRIYVAGGREVSGETFSSGLRVYDPAADSWGTGPSMNVGRVAPGGGALDGTFYAIGGGASSGTTDSVEAFTPCPATPTAPGALLATAISGSQVALSWTDESCNESSFEMERRTGNGAFASVASTAADATGFTDVGLSECTTYTYRVRAVNAAGASSYSNEASATTPDTTPPVITAPSAVTLVTDCVGSAMSITPTTLGFSASDNCDPAPALSCSPASAGPGTTTVDCMATDAAGNVTHASVSVTVLGGPFAFKFLSPLDGTVDNLIKSGQTVPLKVQVSCGTENETGATVTVHSVDQIDSSGTSVANTVPEDSGLANDGGNVFRVAEGSYIYNLSTKGWASTSGARFRVKVRIQETGHVDTFAEVVLKNR
jgi:N-acetylneuraminic acid mutarotase